MTKKYFSKSCLAVNIVLASGKSKHISFAPLTGGGSVYYTDSEDEQAGLRKHASYGKLYKETEVEEPVVEEAPVVDDKPNVVRVASLDEAKDYLGERYGVSRTKMRGADAVKKAAADRGFEFEGLD